MSWGKYVGLPAPTTCDLNLACCVEQARKAVPPISLASLLKLPLPVFVGVGEPITPFVDSFLSIRVRIGNRLTIALAPDATGASLSVRVRF